MASNTLNQLKDKKQYSFEKSWVLLDYSKRDGIYIEDLRNGLSEIGIYLTKQDLSAFFSFIDEDQDGIISFTELKKYWNQNTTIFDA